MKEQAAAEVKVEGRSDSLYLNLSLSLNLLRVGGFFQHPAKLQRPQSQHHQHPEHIGEHTRIEQCPPRTARRLVARQLLLVDEFMGEDQHREHQPQHPTCPRPGVGTADEEVRREITTEQENQRRQDEPD